MDKIPTVTEIEDLSQLKSAVNVYYQPLNKDEGTKKENTLAEKQKEGQAKENKKEEKQDSQDNYPMKEDLGDDNQVTENYEEVNNTRKQQSLGIAVTVAGMSLFSLNRAHKKK